MNIKEQVRAIMTDVKGEFVKDGFMKDTYFQVRNDGEKNMYYVICRWWEKLATGKVDFIDILNGNGTVFVALND